MSKLAVYAFLLFGITVALYIVGFISPMLETLAAMGSGEVATPLLNMLLAVFGNPTFLTIAGAATVVAFLSGGGGDVITYAFPIFMLITFANFFILPTSFVLAVGMDPFSKIIILGFLNLLLGLAVMEFVRSG